MGPDVRDRIQVRGKVAPNETKEDAATRHLEAIRYIQNDPDHILVYTDGPQLKSQDGKLLTGAGVIAYKERRVLWESPIGSDSLAAITGIIIGKVRSGQLSSLRLRSAIFRHLDADSANTITLEWVPGHTNIEGNERSDELAKAGTRRPTGLVGSTLTHARRVAKAKAIIEWRMHHGYKENSGFALADRFLPALKHFRDLPRTEYARVTQRRTMHAFLGEYYLRRSIPESPQCECGHPIETREHLLQHCPIYEDAREIPREFSPDLKVADILGTSAGITALSEILRAAKGAFAKRSVDRPPTNSP